jgi:hypothetical protein
MLERTNFPHRRSTPIRESARQTKCAPVRFSLSSYPAVLLIPMLAIAQQTNLSDATSLLKAHTELRNKRTEAVEAIRACPYGHTTLKKVRILDGLPRVTDPKLREAVANHDIVFTGTDVVNDLLPRQTVYCTTCGFIFERGLGPWTKQAEDPSSFPQPFSRFLREFPLAGLSHRTNTEYSQRVHNGAVTSEGLYFSTTEPLALLKEQVVKWAESHRLILTPATLPEVKPHRPYEGARLITEQQQLIHGNPGTGVNGFHIFFVTYPEEGIVKIDLKLEFEPAAKDPANTITNRE